jgi:hypothetical protein
MMLPNDIFFARSKIASFSKFACSDSLVKYSARLRKLSVYSVVIGLNLATEKSGGT